MTRTRTILGLFMIALLSSAVWAEALLSPGEFTREYVQTLQQARKELVVRVIAPLELKVKGPDVGEVTVYLDNAYAFYRRAPDDKTKIIAHYVAGNLESLKKSDGTPDPKRILPIIKTRDWLATARRLAKEQGAKMIPVYPHEVLTRELIVLYAEDSPISLRYLTQDNIDKLKLKPEQLRELARENLRRVIPRPSSQHKDGVYVIRTGSAFDVSLILLTRLWTEENFPVKGDIVIAVPVREAIYLTGSENKNGLETLRDMAKEAYDSDPYRLTTTLHVNRDGKWVEFMP